MSDRKTGIKGPAIFLAQFAGDAAPFDSLPNIARWAADGSLRRRRIAARTSSAEEKRWESRSHTEYLTATNFSRS